MTLALEHHPDVALLDIRMPGDGIAAARRIASALPDTRILMLTVSADSDDVLDALQAGAQGYVLKGASPEEIVEAVRAVHEGAAVHRARQSRPTVVQRDPPVARPPHPHRRGHVGRAHRTRVADPATPRPGRVDDRDRGGAVRRARDGALAHLALTRKLEVRNRTEAVALFRSQHRGQRNRTHFGCCDAIDVRRPALR